MTVRETHSNELKNSVLVVAHPDDEILWFGSIAAEVDKIVICFLNDPAHPEMANRRRQTLREHPWKKKLVCLELEETGSFACAKWPIPATTKYGLEIVHAPKVRSAYRKCAKSLRRHLQPIIQQADNIFTHNPWGEYGHEEHVLVHSVVSALAEENGKATWYSNYASNWSHDLMLRYLDMQKKEYFSAAVDVPAMQAIAKIYSRHDAWTWLDDYSWFDKEYFVRGPLVRTEGPSSGSMFPVNLLELPDREVNARMPPRSFARRVLDRLTPRQESRLDSDR